MSATVLISFLLVFCFTFTTVVSTKSRGNLGLSRVHKRESDKNSLIPFVETNVNKTAPPGNGDSNTTTSTPTLSGTPGPEDAKNMHASDKLNCSLEANTQNKTNCSNPHSVGNDSYLKSLKNQMIENKDMLLRTLYVTLAITGIIVLYFVTRTVWLRRRRTKSRKYRIIAQNGDQRDLEMEPLGDGNDDDEDYTVFELNGRKK
ncbi:unnamed protein product [Candidula unifasciata]|uniref:Membrane protein FAM174-like n=1 Tax=Candidula unifasciata TaxID=100452 RepID=A0A8S4A7N4_9EUPU|nr:unnamed protein product [Candidula unifasciata]